MKSLFALSILILATPVYADGHASNGDAANGEKLFARQCVACHVVRDDAGNRLAGRNGRTGPNLYGISDRIAGTVEGFRYSKAIIAAGEAGLSYGEDEFAGFVMEPTKYLRTLLDDSRARSKMSFRVRDEQDARDIYAYLAGLAAE